MEQTRAQRCSKRLFDYITLLENLNQQLVKTLEMTTRLLEQFKPLVSDQKTWQDMIDSINHTIELEERINKKKYLQQMRNVMAEKLNPKETVSFKELLMANTIQMDTLAQLLIEKGIIDEVEFFLKLKQAQGEWESKKGVKV